MTDFVEDYFAEHIDIIDELSAEDIYSIVTALSALRDRKGRLFILGVGGSAATASHAVNDFRKITALECYTPTDNVAELTARTNDDGWHTAFKEWLVTSSLCDNDIVMVVSVGGGGENVSQPIVEAVSYAVEVGSQVLGIVGRDGGYTKQVADICLLIPPLYEETIVSHTEGIASVVLHLVTSHPALS